MISYHPASANAPVGTHFTKGFKVADTDDPVRLSRCFTRFAWSPTIFRDGHRCKGNFLFADWIGLDFEDANFTLAQAVKSFSDMIHVIGTTRSHQTAKDGAAPIDRFRVVLKLDKRAESVPDFEWTLKGLGERYPVDAHALEAGRHFFPCRDIVSIVTDGYCEELQCEPPGYAEKKRLDDEICRRRFALTGKIPRHIELFLKTGKTFGAGRNESAFMTQLGLLNLGFSQEEITDAIKKAPFDRTGFQDTEIASTAKNARKLLLK